MRLDAKLDVRELATCIYAIS